MDQWFDYVYLRDNPRGLFEEYVHHSGGCRAWLVVTRNTETHEVKAVTTARDHARRRK
jgi:sarcosine oxidase subunit delta